MTHDGQSISLHAIREEVPGPRWRALYDATWPGYRAWYLRPGAGRRPVAMQAEAALLRYMPQLHPTWRRLVDLAGGDSTAAAILTHWNMPAFAPACSQVVVDNHSRALIRNYDYHPELFEQVVMSTRFTDREVIGTSDCLWGLLDGMNSDGLAVSLTFGGAKVYGPGFGIPLVVRYLLEVAGTVSEALTALRRIPVSMSYNLTLTDRDGCVRTAYVAPGQPMEIRAFPLATNHRFDRPDEPVQARRFRSLERQEHLLGLLRGKPHPDALAEEFLREPLRSTDCQRVRHPVHRRLPPRLRRGPLSMAGHHLDPVIRLHQCRTATRRSGCITAVRFPHDRTPRPSSQRFE